MLIIIENIISSNQSKVIEIKICLTIHKGIWYKNIFNNFITTIFNERIDYNILFL